MVLIQERVTTPAFAHRMLPLQYLANNWPKDNTNPNMTWGTSNCPTYTLFDNGTIGKFAHLRYTQIYGDVKYFKLLEQLAVVCKAIWPRAAMWSTKGSFKKMHKDRRFRVY